MKEQTSNSIELKLKYLNDVEAAKIAHMSVQTFRNWRFQGRGPAYIKVGRSVRYSLTDLISWLEGRKISPEKR
jgi:hypothetical protein